MRLVVDIGNTLVKGALFDGLKLAEVFEPSPTSSIINRWAQSPGLCSIWVSTVKPETAELSSGTILPKFIGPDLKLPFDVKYQSTDTLGKDRLAAVAGSLLHSAGYNTLVVNLGTCITFDVITADKQYLGGAISPGMYMRFKAMHEFTAALPEASPKDYFHFIGGTTRQSLASGVLSGIFSEIVGFSHRVEKQFGSVQLIVTGGDHEYFSKLPIDNFIISPWLVLEGINYIAHLNS